MLQGSCLCGAVAYQTGQVRDASHCYCTMCQKQHGAGAGSYANVERDGFSLLKGADMVVEYASSDDGRRGFCKVCGSNLYWRSTSTPERISVTLGTLEPEYAGPVQRELHTDTKPGWLPVK